MQQTIEARTKAAFGAWLLIQDERKGLIGRLAKAAAADRGFPRCGTPDEVRARLIATQVDGDMFEALDDAELDWAAY